MDFSDALRAMRNGHKVRRVVWDTRDVWAGTMEIAQVSLDGDAREQLICRKQDGSWFTFGGSQWDILSHDWEIAG